MNVRVLGRRFNYVVTSEIYYTQVLVWIFNVTFCISISPFCSGTDGSNSLYSTHLTRSEFLAPARGIAYTNITHYVISLSLCKYTLFSKSEDHLYCNQCAFVRQEELSHNVRDNVSSRDVRISIRRVNFHFARCQMTSKVSF